MYGFDFLRRLVSDGMPKVCTLERFRYVWDGLCGGYRVDCEILAYGERFTVTLYVMAKDVPDDTVIFTTSEEEAQHHISKREELYEDMRWIAREILCQISKKITGMVIYAP